MIGEVFKHYVNRPDRLVVDWETYARLCQHHLKAVQQRLEAGITIPATEQQELLSQRAALCYEPEEPIIASDPPDLRLPPNQWQLRSELTSVSPAEFTSEPPMLSSVDPSQPISEPFPAAQSANPEPIETGQQAPIPVDQTFQQKWQGAISRIAKPMPPGQSSRKISATTPQSLEEAIHWLQDPILQQSAVLWAKRHGYCVEYDAIGQPLDIYLF